MYRLRASEEPGVFYIADSQGRDVGELAWTKKRRALEASWFNGEKWMALGEYSAGAHRIREAAIVARVRDTLLHEDPWGRAHGVGFAEVGAEVTNEDRAAWAGEALETFCLMTRHDPGDRDLRESLGDLLGNLMHLARIEGDPDLFEDALETGRGYFEEELAEELEESADEWPSAMSEAADLGGGQSKVQGQGRKLYDFGGGVVCRSSSGAEPPGLH